MMTDDGCMVANVYGCGLDVAEMCYNTPSLFNDLRHAHLPPMPKSLDSQSKKLPL